MKTSTIIAAIILVVAASTLVPHANGATASIPTEGESWDHSTLAVVITPAQNSTWFKPTYTSDVSIAIERWEETISLFTRTYGFLGLRQLHFSVYITGINETSSPDIIISFVLSDPSFLGVTHYKSTFDGYFQKPVTTQLATFDSSNTRQLSDVDMVNVAKHEFGHGLGLDHPPESRTSDGFLELMYRDYGEPIDGPNNFLLEPSTLDLYALATIYKWLPGTPPSVGLPVTTVTLPSGTPYTTVVAYSDQIASLKAMEDQLNLKVLVLAVLVIAFFVSTIALAVLFTRRKPMPVPAPLYPPLSGKEPSPGPSAG